MNNRGIISVSMMCSELGKLGEELKIYEENRVDYLHVDVMDGEFVPNLGLGTDYISGLRKMTNIPLDIHLMINRPEEKFDWFGITPRDIVTVHYESTIHLNRTLEKAHVNGNKVFLAINPGTPVFAVEEVLDDIDGINLLMVNPGFAAQPMVKSCMEKAKRLRDFLNSRGYEQLLIEADGNITPEHAVELKESGVRMFVAGTSSVYRDSNIIVNLMDLKKSIC